MKSFKTYITESMGDTKGWVNPKSKKAYSTERMRPYHVEFIVRKPRDYGVSKKQILDYLEKKYDLMDALDPATEAKQAYDDMLSGRIDIDRNIEVMAMKKGWYRVVGGTYGSIGGLRKPNDRELTAILNMMEDEGIIGYGGGGTKEIGVEVFEPSDREDVNARVRYVDTLDRSMTANLLRGRKRGDKQTEIGRTMAMFREFVMEAVKVRIDGDLEVLVVQDKEGNAKIYDSEEDAKKTAKEISGKVIRGSKGEIMVQVLKDPSLRKIGVFQESKRIPKTRKNQDPDTHSDLYTDEDPRGTIHGLGFKDVETAEASVRKIESSDRSHAHKIQAAIAMEQRAKVMKKNAEAAVYRRYIEKMKKKTKKMNEAFNLRSLVKNNAIVKAVQANRNKPQEALMLALLNIPVFAAMIKPDNLTRANIIGTQLKSMILGEDRSK